MAGWPEKISSHQPTQTAFAQGVAEVVDSAPSCAAVTPYLEFVRDRVTPTLREVGYTGRRSTYRFLREGGHVAVFWLHQWRLRKHELEFFVDQELVVRDWVEYIHWWQIRSGRTTALRPVEKSDSADGPLRRRLLDPAKPKRNDYWQLDRGDAATTDHFTQLLRRDAVELAELTDPDLFEQRLRAGSLRQRQTQLPPDAVLLVLLLVGQRRFDEARKRLPETENWPAYDDLGEYVAERAKEA